MATPPDFTAGQVLTAAQMNSVAMWEVASGTLSGTTTNFQNCFTDDFDKYVIKVSHIRCNAANTGVWFRFMIGASALSSSDYRWSYVGLQTNNTQNNNASNGNTLGYTGAETNLANEYVASLTMDVFHPKLIARTFTTSQSFFYGAEWTSRNGGCGFTSSQAVDGIQFLTNGANTFTDGRVTIYGCRK
jgi:hypothetical protein